MTMFVTMFARTRVPNVQPNTHTERARPLFAGTFLACVRLTRFPTYFASLVRKPTTHTAAVVSSTELTCEATT